MVNNCEEENMNENESFSDTEPCDENITKLFTKCTAFIEKEIIKKQYILHITCTSDNSPTIGLGLSNRTCDIYNLSNNALAKICSLTEHEDVIIDCKFSIENNNLLYSGSYDGLIKLWDLRDAKNSVLSFKDTTASDSSNSKKINCFDVSPNCKLLAAGTELYETDAFILFWDVRNAGLLGGYWESHTDDITQVKFHPDDSNKLISGSTDGLINVYNLEESCEDDALQDTLNTESSIEKLIWYNESGTDGICCTTHTNDIQLWKLDGVQPFKHLKRNDIANGIGTHKSVYIAGTHALDDGLLTLAGVDSNHCLRTLKIINGTEYPALLLPNRQLVRTSWFNQHTNLFLTGGEEGVLNVFKANLPQNHFNYVPVKRKK